MSVPPCSSPAANGRQLAGAPAYEMSGGAKYSHPVTMTKAAAIAMVRRRRLRALLVRLRAGVGCLLASCAACFALGAAGPTPPDW